jgi:two-component system sensor histidine kinase UhpB
MLDDLGLVSAARWYVTQFARRLNIEAKFEEIGLEERLDGELETVLYRVVQEALTNVARHAQASEVRLRLERDGSRVVAVVTDDGQGFDTQHLSGSDATAHGVGLLGIRERVALLGGRFDIQSHPGQGTRLCIEIPL